MAPSKPSARTLRTQRLTGRIHPLAPLKTFRPEASTSDSFLSSKHDKRLMKHSSFLSRVTSSSSTSQSRVSKPRRRGGNKAPQLKSIDDDDDDDDDDDLAAELGVLKDALPDVQGRQNDGKINHRSLKSKKGALRRKERIVKGEMERFGASMAQLQSVDAFPPTIQQQQQQQQNDDASAKSATTNRWAALRGFISATMKQNPAFENQ